MIRIVRYLKYILSYVKLFPSKIRGMHLPIQAIVGRGLSLTGKGTIKIEKGFVVRDWCRIQSDGELFIGQRCFMNNNVSITCLNKIVIGNDVSIGNNVVIVDHNHNYKMDCMDLFKKSTVTIGDNVWIGANVVILPNTQIGSNSVIGAGTVVKGIIESNTVNFNNRELISHRI